MNQIHAKAFSIVYSNYEILINYLLKVALLKFIIVIQLKIDMSLEVKYDLKTEIFTQYVMV